ncbi:hypothetical protein [Bradyrhizobium sp. LA6.7]|uniref:hypothetical protein n=1 Tax=unclassified Bradyrhizobium TaxID=2631580 RepID=UPI003394DDB7
MTTKQKLISTVAAVATIAALLTQAQAIGGSYTIAPNENREIYTFGNMSGYVTIETDQPIDVRWIHTGEKKDVVRVSRNVTIELPNNKIDGRLEASNPNLAPAFVRITEHTKASNLAQTWEKFWGTVAGGKHSVPNDVHRQVKEFLRKPFG